MKKKIREVKKKTKIKEDKRIIFHCKISESSDIFRQFVKKKQKQTNKTLAICAPVKLILLQTRFKR